MSDAIATTGEGQVTSDPLVQNVDATAPTEPAPAAELTPEQKAEAEAAAAAKAAEDAKAARRAELDALAARERQKLQERRSLQAKLARRDQEYAAVRARLEQQEAILRRLDEDPLAVVEERGVTAQKLAERVIKSGTPENQLEQLRAELAELKAAKEREQQQAQEAQRHAQMRAAEQAFLETTEDAEKYPALSALPPEYRAAEAWKVVQAAAAKGYFYENDEIAAFLESREKPRYEKLISRLMANGATRKEAEAQASENANGKPTGTEATPAGTPRTLTNSLTASRASGSTPLDQLPEHEQNRILAEEFKKLRAGPPR